MNILVSACLLGVNTRYDGNNCFDEQIISLSAKYNLIPICPEVLGGLNIPRLPCEIVNDKIKSKDNQDMSENYYLGANKVLQIAKEKNCKYAILKDKSPSCGSRRIYDGNFNNNLINGKGITTSLLEKNGIRVFSEDEIKKFLNTIV